MPVPIAAIVVVVVVVSVTPPFMHVNGFGAISICHFVNFNSIAFICHTKARPHILQSPRKHTLILYVSVDLQRYDANYFANFFVCVKSQRKNMFNIQFCVVCREFVCLFCHCVTKSGNLHVIQHNREKER